MSFPASTLFNWPKSLEIFSRYFPMEEEPWLWLPKIEGALRAIVPTLSGTKRDIPPGVVVGENVYIHPSVDLPHVATIQDNIYIGAGTKLKPGAYIRSNVIIGDRCVVGNSCEVKNVMLLECVQAPHFNYIGDSILGSSSHLGAGAILSNLRFDKQSIVIKLPLESYATGLRKVGAFIGDGAQLGCNSVLQPGTVLGRNACVMSVAAYGGFLEDGCTVIPRDRRTTIVSKKKL
ncbi:MAG: UDP-N-acetylglucosamine diphosphorylase [Puniceicoccales bacterium]|jgi:NDP-sugar pyrophosphorylase family protein|nr:UDP-N-acetylglucosamine diphosphorylase [Puniceicoccales bacterium]